MATPDLEGPLVWDSVPGTITMAEEEDELSSEDRDMALAPPPPPEEGAAEPNRAAIAQEYHRLMGLQHSERTPDEWSRVHFYTKCLLLERRLRQGQE